MGASPSQPTPQQPLVNVCKLNSVYVAPPVISSKKLSSVPKTSKDLADDLFVAEYEPHEYPSATAAISLVARAYGKTLKPDDIEDRLPQPSSLQEVCELLRWNMYAVLPNAEHINYYLNLNIPVLACMCMPVEWLQSGLERVLTVGMYEDSKSLYIAAVIYSFQNNLVGVAFDIDRELSKGLVEISVIEMFARDVCVIDVADQRKGLKIKPASSKSD